MLVCYCDIYCNDCHLWSLQHVSAIFCYCDPGHMSVPTYPLYSLLSFVIHYWVLLFITEFLLSCKCAFSGITPTCNKQLHTNHLPCMKALPSHLWDSLLHLPWSPAPPLTSNAARKSENLATWFEECCCSASSSSSVPPWESESEYQMCWTTQTHLVPELGISSPLR